ncbi:MAG: hypothetical protein R3B96_07710 [Pirellulaceae bacterium]
MSASQAFGDATIAILRRASSRVTRLITTSRSRPRPVAAAELSQRYIADRFLPDKAIDLPTAASRLAMERDSVPAEIDAVQR